MNSEEVPQKFTDWLILMGCPPVKIPSIEKVKQMCRGDYYMVWRNMMERVQAKQQIREKRHQVFLDDIKKCQKNKSSLKETITKLPEELLVWQEHQEVRSKRQDVESRVMLKNQDLKELMRIVSTKIVQCKAVEHRVQDRRRRAWLLVRLAEELRSLQENLKETRTTALAFQQKDDNGEVQVKIDKCMSLFSRQNSQNCTNPAASLSLMSAVSDTTDFDIDDQLSLLLGSGSGGEIWTQLWQRRSALFEKLAAANSQVVDTDAEQGRPRRMTAQSVAARSAALQGMLTLDTLRNKQLISKLHGRLTSTLNQFHNNMKQENWDLLILRCQRAKLKARLATTRSQLDRITSCSGLYKMEEDLSEQTVANTIRQITKIHRSMESKKSDLKLLLAYLSKMEYRIQSVKDNLQSIFGGFQEDIAALDCTKFTNMDDPHDLTVFIRQFYDQRKSKARSKAELSLDLEISETSFDSYDRDVNQKPKLTDELKFYLRNFNLEKNRRLVFQSGESRWIFESLQESAHRLYTKCNEERATDSLICPALTLAANIERLVDSARWHSTLHRFLEMIHMNDDRSNSEICDITPLTTQSEMRMDKVKKQLSENLLSLQKTEKTITKGRENLRLWSENQWRKYISEERTIDGRCYREYEAIYLENLNSSVQNMTVNECWSLSTIPSSFDKAVK